jgi:transcriptional regulator with XRE-family HTH domain
LIAARLEAGLTQRQLARRAETSASTLASYESGRREPRLSTLARLLDAAGMELRMTFDPKDPGEEATATWFEELPADVRQEWVGAHQRRIDAIKAS